MDFGQILGVLTPALFGLVACVFGLGMLRPARGESRVSKERTIGGVLLILFAVGCVLASFALWVCVGLSNAMH